VIGRESPYSLYDKELVTFEDGAPSPMTTVTPKASSKLNALRLPHGWGKRKSARWGK